LDRLLLTSLLFALPCRTPVHDTVPHRIVSYRNPARVRARLSAFSLPRQFCHPSVFRLQTPVPSYQYSVFSLGSRSIIPQPPAGSSMVQSLAKLRVDFTHALLPSLFQSLLLSFLSCCNRLSLSLPLYVNRPGFAQVHRNALPLT
jgi:hypothetical protein